jgi:hypothetical protein
VACGRDSHHYGGVVAFCQGGKVRIWVERDLLSRARDWCQGSECASEEDPDDPRLTHP